MLFWIISWFFAVMARERPSDCERCGRLEQNLQERKERIAQLEAELAKAKKNSKNSSKPPSSEITKQDGKKKTADGKSAKRKRGGQPGHPRHQRPAFEPSEVDRYFDYYGTAILKCPVQAARAVQVGSSATFPGPRADKTKCPRHSPDSSTC